jgi:trehalose-6-phosphate synthase
MTRITEKRVVVATLFLPYTVDFELQEKKKRTILTNTIDSPVSTTNLIQSLAKHQQKEETKSTSEQSLFDFTKPEELVQPRSKQQRDEEIRKLTPLLSVIPSQSRRPSIDTAQVFADAPWSVKPCSGGNIGLNNALFSIQHQLDQLAWVGTLGMPTDPLSQKTRDEIQATFNQSYNAFPVMPSDTVFDGHYNRYCKQVKKKKKVGLSRDDC